MCKYKELYVFVQEKYEKNVRKVKKTNFSDRKNL